MWWQLVRFVLRLMERADHGISAASRRFGGWRMRACPACTSRRLELVKTELWTGIPGTQRCSTYRCRGCGGQLFAEQDGAPMTMSEHERWREAKEMRVLALALPSDKDPIPRAVVRRR